MSGSDRRIWDARRVAFALLLGVLTLGGTAALAWTLRAGGLDPIEGLLIVVYGGLQAWIGAGFLVSAFGFGALLSAPSRRAAGPSEPLPCGDAAPLPGSPGDDGARTAVVVPIYNENVDRVFAGVRAIYASLSRTGRLAEFDFFVLSDTTDPEVWLAEEQAWYETCRALGAAGRLFYRHRSRNEGRKCGNIAEFCRRWGRRYAYMVVLDADSIISGSTLLTMVRSMDRNPRLGLLQAWTRPVNGQSLFARAQQFAASLCGRLSAAGLRAIQQGDGNYWGHNAIIRVTAFMENCGLPRLPGRAPLGGEILSHDFVEAALMARAGWEVRLSLEPDESYEEGPPSLLDHLKRDRRWCQGNLQHARLLLARGLKPMSRIHFLFGVLTYVSAPLWLAFVLLSAVVAWQNGIRLPSAALAAGPASAEGVVIVSLLGLTAALLLLPKAMGCLAVCLDREARRRHGGALGVCVGVVLETLLSTLVAPVMMMRHCVFVATVLAGHSVAWAPQTRAASAMRLRDAFSAHALETVAGAAMALVVLGAAPAMLPWLSPFLAGLVLAAPISAYSGRIGPGRFCRRLGLFLIPEEHDPPETLKALSERESPAGRGPAPASRFQSVLLDPFANALHCALADAHGHSIPAETRRALTERFLHDGIEELSEAERLSALSDTDYMQQLCMAARLKRVWDDPSVSSVQNGDGRSIR